MAKITINRPQVRNAFRPETLAELQQAFNFARDDDKVGVIIFTGEGTEASVLVAIFQYVATMDISEAIQSERRYWPTKCFRSPDSNP